MLTLRKEESLIKKLKALPEMELEAILEELNEHLNKNRMSHVADHAFGQERIDELEHDIDELEDEKKEIESERDDYQRWNLDACKILETIDCDDAPEDIEKQIKRAIEILS
jgi:hypothetical protein